MKHDEEVTPFRVVAKDFFDDEFATEIDALVEQMRVDLACDGAFVNVRIEGRRLYTIGAGLAMDIDLPRINPEEGSMCTHTARKGTPLVVPDAHQHPIFAKSPQVTAGMVTAYMGHPITDSSGEVFGTISATSLTRRQWNGAETALLRSNAALAGSLFQIRQLKHEAAGLHVYINEADRALLSLSNNLTGLISVHDGQGQEIFSTAELRASVTPLDLESSVRSAIRVGAPGQPQTTGGPVHMGGFEDAVAGTVDGTPVRYSLQLWRSTEDTYYAFWKSPVPRVVH